MASSRFCAPLVSRSMSEAAQYPATIFVSLAVWGRIRGRFTEAEKDVINDAICGEAICPRGATLAVAKLDHALEAKLREALKG